eukprot:8950712-Pyramimonas_sp.AAC.1
MSPTARGGSQATGARTNIFRVSCFADRMARIISECCSPLVPRLVEMPQGNRSWPPLLAALHGLPQCSFEALSAISACLGLPGDI